MTIEEIIKANFKDEFHKAIVNIRFTSNWIGNHYQQQLDPYGITLPQFNILRILRGASEKLSIRIVKERMIEKSPNTTRLIDKMIEKKLVSRTRCKEDRRVVFVKITDLGLELLEKLDREFTDISVRDFLSQEEVMELNRLLNKARG